MKDIRIISGKKILPSLDVVLGLMGCGRGQQDSDKLQEIYNELLSDVKMRVRPKAALTMGELSGKKVLYVMLTVGDGICRLGEKYASHDMLRTTLLDAMADSCLFAFEEQILPIIRRICKEEGYGIARRLEVPGDFPMEVQKQAYDAVEAERTLGLKITSGYMLDPVKSMCILFELSEDIEACDMEHDCGRCGNINCKLRSRKKIVIQIQENAMGMRGAADAKKRENTQITCEAGRNLREVLQEQGIYVSTPCGGKGTCGKCSVLVTEGELTVTAEDKKAFSEEELKKGKRLACKAVLQSDLTIQLMQNTEETFLALGSEGAGTSEQFPRVDNGMAGDDTAEQFPRLDDGMAGNDTSEPFSMLDDEMADQGAREAFHVGSDAKSILQQIYGIAVDIGTTTIAMSLVELTNGRVLDTVTGVNHQRAFGADVISRIQSANAKKGEKLRQLIQEDLLAGMEHLIQRNSISYGQIRQMVIAANTTMLHLLRGYSCEGLGSYPFAPVTLEQETCAFHELFERFEKDVSISVTLLPGISAFVGADIVAGLYEKGFWEAKDCARLLIDLGTNGEMALQTPKGIFVTSVAAGPAFEGGNIKWGMGSVPGAISKVEIDHGKAKVSTIGDAFPEGICGTGVIETVAELLWEEILDETGKLTEPYFETGYPLAANKRGEQIVLTQQDIREIQMAKAAIRAGIQILLMNAGISGEEVGQVYLAGGFGYYLDVKKVETIGIFPSKMLDKIEAAGNTSLKGAIRFLTHPEEVSYLQQIREHAREIPVAETKAFQELYLNYMGFEREEHE